MLERTISRIISGNEKLAEFWSNCHGWAPIEAAELISKSRLDWQIELSNTLLLWTAEKISDGELILAWANLGALIEGTLKLYLSVYYFDYLKDEESIKDRSGIITPDILALEKLKQFFRKKELLNPELISLIETVQLRRNAIHAFKTRPLGDRDELNNCISRYLELIIFVNNRLPYPEPWGSLEL